MDFRPEEYGLAVAELLETELPYLLVPARPQAELRDTLAALDHAALFADAPIVDRDMADACLSGLWLRFDFLDESHTISQGILSSTGSFWHGIMHRREPDWSNAKYWFRRVGDHDVFGDLLSAARVIAEDGDNAELKSLAAASAWDPFAFVDLCQAATQTGGAFDALCRRIQTAEWELLFDWCYRRAVRE